MSQAHGLHHIVQCVFLAALQRRPVSYHSRWLLTVLWPWPSIHWGQLSPTTLPQCRLVSHPCSAGLALAAPVVLFLSGRKRCVTFEIWGRKGVPMFHHQTIQLNASMAAHISKSACTHHPPTVPVSPQLSLCGSFSPSLSVSLSLSLSLSLSISLSGPRPTVTHSLSLSYIGVFGMFGRSLSPPGFEHSPTGQIGAVYPLSYEEWLSAF